MVLFEQRKNEIFNRNGSTILTKKKQNEQRSRGNGFGKKDKTVDIIAKRVFSFSLSDLLVVDLQEEALLRLVNSRQ